MDEASTLATRLPSGAPGYLMAWTGEGNRCKRCYHQKDPKSCLPTPCELNSWGNPFRGRYPFIVLAQAPAPVMDNEQIG